MSDSVYRNRGWRVSWSYTPVLVPFQPSSDDHQRSEARFGAYGSGPIFPVAHLNGPPLPRPARGCGWVPCPGGEKATKRSRQRTGPNLVVGASPGDGPCLAVVSREGKRGRRTSPDAEPALGRSRGLDSHGGSLARVRHMGQNRPWCPNSVALVERRSVGTIALIIGIKAQLCGVFDSIMTCDIPCPDPC